MSFGAVFAVSIAVHLYSADVVSGREYKLTGTTNFRIQRGEVVTVKGYYKYCLASTSCPSCIRQVYLNLFGTSRCLASIGKSQLDCKEHHFTHVYTAPNTAGSYGIKMQEVLEYNCNSNFVSSSGLLVGTVLVQEPPSIINSSSLPVVFSGDSLTLQCSARGYPQPVIRWYKDGSLVHENTSLQFSSLNESDTGFYQCNASNIAGSDTYEVEVLVRERRPIINQTILAQDADKLLQNDSVVFIALLTHDLFSGDKAFNIKLVWMLPNYARYLSHEPRTNVTTPYPGEHNFEIEQIQLGASVEINITVQIDHKSTLSVGRHFLTIPTFLMYEQRMANGATKIFVGSVESVTVNFTVREDVSRGFLMNPLSGEVYFCKEKKSDSVPSCYVSFDGAQWTGIDSRVKMISGMIVSGLHKRIFAVTRNDRCHVVSENGIIWSCITPEEWQQESSSKDFVRAVSVPRSLKSALPESHFVNLKNDGTVSYGGKYKTTDIRPKFLQ
ncbi:titin-like [Orbicella faveolata]|uniref:titin-like n=1 Tax=Orbicella faveolata TaxID=48498 RepID=UPI0009E620A0|nr:titin-like [Orbicella faveolata]